MKFYYFNYQYILLNILCWIFVFSSCTKEIKLEEAADRALSIYPILEAGKEIKINAMPIKSIPDTMSYKLTGGLGFVFVNNTCMDTVILSEKGQGTSKVVAKSGESYTIKVKADGFPQAEITTSIPFPVKLLKIDTMRHYNIGPNSILWQIDIYFKIDKKIKEYYRVSISSKYIYEYRYLEFKASISLLHNLTYSNNQSIDFYLYGDTKLYLSEEPRGLMESPSRKVRIGAKDGYMQSACYYMTNTMAQSDTIIFSIFANDFMYLNLSKVKYLIEVATLSPDYYKALYSYAKYYTNKEQDLPVTEPVMIYSNVKNGFGYAAALATSVDSSICSDKYREFYNQ